MTINFENCPDAEVIDGICKYYEKGSGTCLEEYERFGNEKNCDFVPDELMYP